MVWNFRTLILVLLAVLVGISIYVFGDTALQVLFFVIPLLTIGLIITICLRLQTTKKKILLSSIAFVTGIMVWYAVIEKIVEDNFYIP